MKKNITKIISTILALTLLFSALPMGALAAGGNITSEIQDVYRAAKKSAGVSSFSGWCGAYVGHTLLVKGINRSYVGCNGNDAFDTYKRLSKSTGGYYISAYSASNATLKQVLNKITNNGQKTVNNVLVGFQRGSGEAGRKYGHCVLIHQISNGTVYFSESFGVNLNGKYYAEGAAIAASVDQFCRYYCSWAECEGVIHFKTYMDLCTLYSTVRQVKVTKATTFKSLPCSKKTDSASYDIRNGKIGEIVTVIGLFRNSVGNYWYAVKVDGKLCYLFAGDATRLESKLYRNQYDSNNGYSLQQG